MTSIGPYTESCDMKQMFSFSDYRKPKPPTCYPKNSIMDIISRHPDLTLYSQIIKKANMDSTLSDSQANFTVFIASDTELKKKYTKEFFDKMDKGTAHQIMRTSMMNRQIDKYLIQSSPSSMLPTMDRSNTLYVNTVDGITYLPNGISFIHWNQPATNGLIHIIDDIIKPSI